MPTISIKVDTGSVSRTINNIIRELGPAKNYALHDIGTAFVNEARNNVHVITGKTKNSTKIKSVSGNTVIVESAYGAPFEEAKGSPHDFMTQATETIKTEGPKIINDRLQQVMKSGGITR